MYDVNDDAKNGYRRVEVLTGRARRRRWSAGERERIVAETLAPGARVSEVARRWQVCPQQVFGWRRAACHDARSPSAEVAVSASPGFVPIVADVPSAPAVPAPIEIKLAGAVLLVAPGMDGAQLTAVLRVVRVSALRS